MGDLSQNISRHEVECNCGCGFNTADVETVSVLQELCDDIALQVDVDRVVLHIHSWCRCLAWNDHEGGSEYSEHIRGRAVDFHIDVHTVTDKGVVSYTIDPSLVYERLNHKYPNKFGLGNYKNFTHLDTRSEEPARWVG